MIEDNPDWQIYTRMMQALYHTSTARTSIAGTVESISHITAETLYDCHKAFYTPSNMILTVVATWIRSMWRTWPGGSYPGRAGLRSPGTTARNPPRWRQRRPAWPWRSLPLSS